MFTGLVDDIGFIEQVSSTAAGRELRVQCRYHDLVNGESIAINGACLTVRECGEDNQGRGWFTVAAVVTTLERTNIGTWRADTRINLERAMRLGDRLGGHLVLGHVDDLGTVTSRSQYGDALLIDIALPVLLQPLMVAYGSITVNGVSLTVNALLENGVQLSIIDYTQRHTTLGALAVGDTVHIEADVLAKHVERLLAPQLAQRETR